MLNNTDRQKFIFEYAGQKYCLQDIVNALKKTGIQKGDSIFVHSDLKSFGKIINVGRNEYIETFIKALINTIGESGNLIMPTFSYTFCKRQDFDPESTPSTVGIMTEHFRKLPDVRRSIDAIFSVAAYGPDKEYFTNVNTDCFGKESIFEKLYLKNAKIVFIGNIFDITYMHFVEQDFGVPYRFIKKFSGKVKIGNERKNYTFNYNVRPLDQNIEYDLEKIANNLDSFGILRKAKLGYSQIRTLDARKVFKIITQELEKNVYFLLAKNPKEIYE